MRQTLRRQISNVSTGRVLHGTVISVVKDRVSVDLGSGHILNNIEYVGGPLSIGQRILVDQSSGIPRALARAWEDSLSTTTTTVTPAKRVMNSDPDVPSTSTNNATKIHNIPVDFPSTEKYLMYDELLGRYTWQEIQTGGVVGKIEDLSDQIPATGNHFSTMLKIAAGSLRVFWNGLRQEPGSITVDADGMGFTTTFTPETGERLVADYGADLSNEPATTGHTIQGNGVSLPMRAKLNFVGAAVTDDTGNDATVISMRTAFIEPLIFNGEFVYYDIDIVTAAGVAL